MRLACVVMLTCLAAPDLGQGAAQRAETRRCEPESLAWKAGRQALGALHERITSLADNAPPGPTLDQVECFARIDGQRNPQLVLAARELEVRPHHADDLVRCPAQIDGPAENPRIPYFDATYGVR